jgi:hypothetical protein
MAERAKRKNCRRKVKSGVSKASIFPGITEDTIKGWIKEEEKMLTFVAAAKSDVRLQREKRQVGEDNEVDDCISGYLKNEVNLCQSVG